MLNYFELSTRSHKDSVEGDFLGISLKYTYELAKLKFINYWRINIIINEYYPEQGNVDVSPLNHDLVHIFYKRNMADYKNFSDEERYKLQLEIINSGLGLLFEKKGWDYSAIEKTGADIYNAGFVFEVPIILRGLPDGYEFLVRPSLKTALFFIRITNETGKREIPVFKGTWQTISMESLFKSAKLKNNYLKISNKSKTIAFEVNLSDDEVKINYDEDIWKQVVEKYSADNIASKKIN